MTTAGEITRKQTIWTWLFNPFHYVAGGPALGIGMAILLVAAGIGAASRSHFDGVLDFHTTGAHPEAPSIPLGFYFAEALISWGVMPPLLYLFGRWLSGSRIRFIDVAGTHALARAPLLAMPLMAMLPAYQQVMTPLGDPSMSVEELMAVLTAPANLAVLTLVGVVGIVAIIWMVALMYRAFAVSCNVSGPKAIALFIVALIVGEILSKVLIGLLFHAVVA